MVSFPHWIKVTVHISFSYLTAINISGPIFCQCKFPMGLKTNMLATWCFYVSKLNMKFGDLTRYNCRQSIDQHTHLIAIDIFLKWQRHVIQVVPYWVDQLCTIIWFKNMNKNSLSKSKIIWHDIYHHSKKAEALQVTPLCTSMPSWV